jgi:hypothetical protein
MQAHLDCVQERLQIPSDLYVKKMRGSNCNAVEKLDIAIREYDTAMEV